MNKPKTQEIRNEQEKQKTKKKTCGGLHALLYQYCITTSDLHVYWLVNTKNYYFAKTRQRQRIIGAYAPAATHGPKHAPAPIIRLAFIHGAEKAVLIKKKTRIGKAKV